MNQVLFKGGRLPNTVQQSTSTIVTKPCKLGDDEPVSNGQVADSVVSRTDTVEPGQLDAAIMSCRDCPKTCSR